MTTTCLPQPPSTPAENVEFRRELLASAVGNAEMQRQIWIVCSRDILFFLGTFAFTYSPKDYSDCPDRPFIPYPYQEIALSRINGAIETRHDLLIEKSRDMGATWMCLYVFLWRFLFSRKPQSFLVGSRKEDLVDSPGDPDCLFWKLDYVIERVPAWLTPMMAKSHMHRRNLENGSTIDGESTNADFAAGGRRTGILLDEFPKVDVGHSILQATRDVTRCRIFNGTPEGASGAYYETRTQMLSRNPDQVLTLHWRLHPEKSVGLYSTREHSENGVLELLDDASEFPPGYRFIRDGKLRSIAYDEEEGRCANPREMAQQWDIDYLGSGFQFFDGRILDRLKAKTRKPNHNGELLFSDEAKNPEWRKCRDGMLQLWIEPNADGLIDDLGPYSVGCDISLGVATETSSNSVATVFNKTSGQKVAELTTNRLGPAEFAIYVVALCRWFHSALLVWETNGPGGAFTKKIHELGYARLFMQGEETDPGSKRKKPGWYSTKETKRILLMEYSRALVADAFINPCYLALEECGQYVHLPGGAIEHNFARSSQDPTISGENHGDRVIADALAYRAAADMGQLKVDEAEEIPVGSFAWRQKEFQRKFRSTEYY